MAPTKKPTTTNKTTTKKTTNKSTTAKKPATGRISAKEKEALRKSKLQLNALITFAVGVLMVFLLFVEGSSLWLLMHNSLFGFFGMIAYIVPVVLIYIAVITAMDRPMLFLGSKIWQSILLIMLLAACIQIFFYGSLTEVGIFNQIGEVWNSGIALKSGGIIGAILGLPLLAACGKVGAGVISVLLSIVLLMIITGTTLKGLYTTVSRPVKDLEKAYADRILHQEENPKPPKPEKEPKTSKNRFNIDVPLDAKSPKDLAKEKTEEATTATTATASTDTPVQPIAEKAKPLTKAQAKAAELAALISDMPAHPVMSAPTTESPVDEASAVEEAPTVEAEPIPETTLVKEPLKNAYIDDLIKNIVVKDKNYTKPSEIAPEPLEPVDTGSDNNSSSTENSATGEEVSIETQLQEVMDKETAVLQPVYTFPPISLLKENEVEDDENISEELKGNAQRLVDTLQSFGVQTRITEICRGPAVTRYELQPSAGVKISKITNLADDIALNLAAAGVRIEAPIPNKAAVGIEVPNKNISAVSMREIIDSNQFVDSASRLSVALGKDIAGNLAIADLGKMPHVLIAGATGSGKSVCINSIIISLLYKSSPEEVKLLMIDPKVVELGIYNGIPHLLVPVVTDPRKAAGALNWAVNEMLKRYTAFAENGVRDLAGYNKMAATKDNMATMPQIVIIIDELADLMMAAPNEVEDAICRLAQMARAAGMHLVIATQRPSVDVITGVIKANIPSRIAFSVSSQVDSRTILDGAGAEKLLGRGDMLFYPTGYPKPVRVQGCFVSDTEVEKIVAFIKGGDEARYDQQVIEEIDRQAVPEKGAKGDDGGGFSDEDEMLPAAIEVLIEAGQASTSLLQRKLKLGYARAARIIDQLEERGIIGPFEGSKPRQVLISRERWLEMKLGQGE